MLFRWLPDREDIAWEANKTELTVTFGNKSVLGIRGSDHPDSIRGLNPYGCVIDEFAECKEELWPAILQPIMRRDEARWSLFIFTPKGYNHSRELWDQTQGDPQWFHMALPASKSRLLDPKELEAARRTTPPWLYDQEYECAWITDEEATLITSRLLESLRGLSIVGGEYGDRRVVAIDPAASITGDECVVYYMVNRAVADEDIFHERDPLKIAARAALMGGKYGCENYAVDWTGVGTGVVGRLREMGKVVHEYIAAGSPSDPRFANIRAEAWWDTMLRMMDKEIPYPDGFQSAEMLRQDLSSVKVKPMGVGGRVLLEPKHETKKRLGRSPDKGDAYVIGQWATPLVPLEGPGEPVESFRRLGAETGQTEEQAAMSYAIPEMLE